MVNGLDISEYGTPSQFERLSGEILDYATTARDESQERRSSGRLRMAQEAKDALTRSLLLFLALFGACTPAFLAHPEWADILFKLIDEGSGEILLFCGQCPKEEKLLSTTSTVFSAVALQKILNSKLFISFDWIPICLGRNKPDICVDEMAPLGTAEFYFCYAAYCAVVTLLYETDLIYRIRHFRCVGRLASLALLGAWPMLDGRWGQLQPLRPGLQALLPAEMTGVAWPHIAALVRPKGQLVVKAFHANIKKFGYGSMKGWTQRLGSWLAASGWGFRRAIGGFIKRVFTSAAAEESTPNFGAGGAMADSEAASAEVTSSKMMMWPCV